MFRYAGWNPASSAVIHATRMQTHVHVVSIAQTISSKQNEIEVFRILPVTPGPEVEGTLHLMHQSCRRRNARSGKLPIRYHDNAFRCATATHYSHSKATWHIACGLVFANQFHVYACKPTVALSEARLLNSLVTVEELRRRIANAGELLQLP